MQYNQTLPVVYCTRNIFNSFINPFLGEITVLSLSSIVIVSPLFVCWSIDSASELLAADIGSVHNVIVLTAPSLIICLGFGG